MPDKPPYTVGVLALQGAVSEHLRQLEALGASAVAVKNIEQLQQIDGLILPGGESTAISKLMREYGFVEPIRRFAADGKPLFGTCAGMILLAKEIAGNASPHLALMDIQVQRNAFGRQIDSFETALSVKLLSAPFPAIFIRAPYIRQRLSDSVEVLAEMDGNIVLARQDNLLACAFHPELSHDTRIMALFLDMLK
ncbi:pyridoxal phosphate synthase yaaE subunit [Pasteurella testudinis DSM 23072]|uniref:Pyridoxal 5'-phosphate synthase subunit PdxT n=1 Tax=Pasteurella testudinis DSM 23072 TaxID=1122938 RepID=A0A1W1UYZ2_9PAST|nr:pyridoxal 5'-phosphate synthase glutaminase subunit PdxT [Pasteurella testudinis]SMB86230.1 pyridoxal phosphate synthase yaaE subunit [Pasteurella testudinis DSM 23072]SUB51755.1 glutamine amidotransferase subunit PdxT [Pasteurella testudinis]